MNGKVLERIVYGLFAAMVSLVISIIIIFAIDDIKATLSGIALAVAFYFVGYVIERIVNRRKK